MNRAILVFLGVLTSCETAVADGGDLRADPLADVIAHVRLVEEYEHGDDDRAIAEIIAWKPDVIAGMIEQVEQKRSAGSGATVEVRTLLVKFPVAVMLHTEAGLHLNGRGEVAGAGSQWNAAWRFAELLPFTPEQNAFLRAWYHAFGLSLLGSGNADSLMTLERGRQRFPDDAPIALALARVYEMRGTFVDDVSQYDLRKAEGICRTLLARDPGMAEARLRLGRVLQLRGAPELALPELERVASTAEDARLRYLAHLFTGDLYRRRARLPEAQHEFGKAFEAWPGGQAGALSLAAILHALGERAEAASAVQTAIEDRGELMAPDPYRTYHSGNRAEQKLLLERVKAMVRRSPR
jgi:tetratricopeptide (TPR) repeat protein